MSRDMSRLFIFTFLRSIPISVDHWSRLADIRVQQVVPVKATHVQPSSDRRI